MNIRPFFGKANKTAVGSFEDCKNREPISITELRCAKYPDGIEIDPGTFIYSTSTDITAQRLGCMGCELTQQTSIAGDLQAQTDAFLAEQSTPPEKQ